MIRIRFNSKSFDYIGERKSMANIRRKSNRQQLDERKEHPVHMLNDAPVREDPFSLVHPGYLFLSFSLSYSTEVLWIGTVRTHTAYK